VVRSKAPAETRADGALHGDQDHDSQAGGYYDADDDEISDYGQVASVADLHAVTALVEHYYATAATGNGARALMVPALAKTLAEAYGGGDGPAFLRGACSCTAIVSLAAVRLP
jgi:hypothetical protein